MSGFEKIPRFLGLVLFEFKFLFGDIILRADLLPEFILTLTGRRAKLL